MSPTDDLAAAKYARMRWNTPLAEDHADLLLEGLGAGSGETVCDLGCGWGELLLRAVADPGEASPQPSTRGVGVDTDGTALERGRALAARRGLQDRVVFVERPASGWAEPADRLICVGSAHALGGTRQALAGLAGLVRPGGRMLFGDGCWSRPPTEAAAALFGSEVMPLTDLVAHARHAGWRVLHLSTADQREWDDFEASWRAGREEWLRTHPHDERADSVRRELDAQLAEYVGTYRGVLDFCYLVLSR